MKKFNLYILFSLLFIYTGPVFSQENAAPPDSIQADSTRIRPPQTRQSDIDTTIFYDAADIFTDVDNRTTQLIGKAEIKYKNIPDEFIEVSPHRKEPRCKYTGDCGGCNWQHIDYTQQLRYKRDIFIDCLSRIGKIKDTSEIEIVSSQEWEYRIRAQLKVDMEKRRMGFFRRKTNDVISIDNCPLLDPQINVLLENQKEIIPALPKNSKQLKVIAGTNNSITSKPQVAGFTQSEAIINVGKVKFIVKGNSFFQGNRFLLEKLGLWAAPSVSGEFFIDMYGGLGFFSIMLGKKLSSGLLVESLEKQTELAKRNFIHNGIDHITAKTISAETFFDKESNKIPKPDLIIVDPPRPGLTRMVREGIRDLKPRAVLLS